MTKGKSPSSSKKISNNKKYNLDEFMRKSMISPGFQYTNTNYNNSLESHASLATQASHNVEPIRYESDQVSYHPSSEEDSYSDNEYEYIEPIGASDESYAKTTSNKDLKIYKMKNLLDNKNRLMIDKEREIKELSKQNSLLETIVYDYEKYNDAILEEKLKQKKALKILSDHIREISKNIKSDEFRLNRVKVDQTLLLQEIQNIRDEIEYVLKSKGNAYQNEYISSDDEYSLRL